ncbi:carbonic anhydrase [Psychromonas aquimarina]|uniref:carbonic anhydrase n=1 Tax=Psychromonas aquimarina TaxID=444919 RepID=UPI00041DBB61|nr:carbonic anhydrase family protein [Psychromonas aquimarina]
MKAINILRAGILSGLLAVTLFPASQQVSASSSNNDKSSHSIHWSYSGSTGPEHWGSIAKEFALCSSGMRQSPVDIEYDYPAELYPLRFEYQQVPLKVVNNGHTLQVNYDSPVQQKTVSIAGKSFPIKSKPVYNSKLMLGDVPYKLLQFHFHTPSEHAVTGERYAMEVHLVHQSGDGNLAVVGVLLKRGAQNQILQKVLDNVSGTINRVNLVTGSSINASDLLPDNRLYFHYTGSLTTPPCSENVNWLVMKNTMEVSDQQVSRFAQLIGANARPLQEVLWRTMLLSE